MKVLITTVPFAQVEKLPIKLLNDAKIQYTINPIGRKLLEDELAEMIMEYDAIIAGTEPITEKVLSRAKNLKLISRVGVGLDSVDLHAAKKKNIIVSYTAEAPSPAVADLTIGLMLSTLRSIHQSHISLRDKNWHRFFGRRLSNCVVGIIGYGRIGQKVVDLLEGFKCKKILINDPGLENKKFNQRNVSYAEKEEIYKTADLISLHVPLNKFTKNMITLSEIKQMQTDTILINTSRGGVINEQDLYVALFEKRIAGAAIDVFEKEPYDGKLRELSNCLLTAHLGSMSFDCRNQMEIEATEEIVRFFKGEQLKNIVPQFEYSNN